MKQTVKEIIPDMSFASDGELGLNLYGARYMLEKFLLKFNRKGVANRECLYEILEMDLDQARAFLRNDTGSNTDRASLDPAIWEKAGQTLAALQMMIHAYLNEQMVDCQE
ncbi:MAG: hypothetical protein PVH87_16930 [Desulfobacteraceae bacterium]|jgi:hypothetical protein